MSATASPAVAKGPTDVGVSGPGVDTHLNFRHSPGEVDLGTLAQAARVYDVLGDLVLAKDPGLGPAQLGPRYVLDWTAGGAAMVVQHAYPFAEGGAWIRFPRTSSGWGAGASGWVRAPAVTDQLVALGATPKTADPSPAPMVAATEVSASPDEPAPTDPAGRTPYEVVVPIGLALVVLLAAAVLIARRRRLSP